VPSTTSRSQVDALETLVPVLKYGVSEVLRLRCRRSKEVDDDIGEKNDDTVLGTARAFAALVAFARAQGRKMRLEEMVEVAPESKVFLAVLPENPSLLVGEPPIAFDRRLNGFELFL
jgi:hypothetical protein